MEIALRNTLARMQSVVNEVSVKEMSWSRELPATWDEEEGISRRRGDGRLYEATFRTIQWKCGA